MTAIGGRLVFIASRKFPTTRHIAEDLSQDALVQFVGAVSAGRVDSESRPDLYLLKILEHLCIDTLRRASTAPADSPGFDTGEDDFAAAVVGRVDAGELVRRAIRAALLVQDRTAVAVLQSWKDAVHRYGDPTLAEVRTVSGRSIPTIRSVLGAFRSWASGGEGEWHRL